MTEKAINTQLLDSLRSQREQRIQPLAGKKGIVIGISNDQSIAWGCAQAFRGIGADLCITYLDRRDTSQQ